VVLGVDPSLRGTGFGVIRIGKPGGVSALAFGTVACPQTWERSRCLVKIVQALREVVRQHGPTLCVVEGIFYAQNLQTAMIMGEARGAALAVVAEAGLEIHEMAPRKVKQAVVERMLRLAEAPAPDAADALALALAHAQEQGRYSLTPPKRI
jgi:crossover junction endodeoxyribonuclease RuvC